MSSTLAESYRYCQALTRKTAGNFYYSFLTLPREQFRAMCALYAYMRIVDDIADEESVPLAERQQRLTKWEEKLDLLLAGNADEHPLGPALVDIVQRYEIDRTHLHDVIRGVRSDLQHTGFETFAELQQYCYQVAGVVGLCCVQIWGYDTPEARPLAVKCGTAFQLTNILRDLGEDINRGRVYLPHEDLDRFDYRVEDIEAGRVDERFFGLMQFQIDRARSYYQQAGPLYSHLHAPGKPILSAMRRIYGSLLDEIERDPAAVYQKRIRLSAWRKLYIALSSRIFPRQK